MCDRSKNSETGIRVCGIEKKILKWSETHLLTSISQAKYKNGLKTFTRLIPRQPFVAIRADA